MKRHLWLGAALVAGVFALTGCSDDSDDDNGGAGAGGVASGTGGGAGTAEAGGSAGTTEAAGSAGMTEATAGAAGGGSEVTCPGCAALFVPLAEEATATEFEISLNEAVDLSGEVVTVRFRVDSETNAGGVQFAAKNADGNWYSGWKDLAASSDWTELIVDFADIPSDSTLDATQVEVLTLQISAGDQWDDGGAVWADATVYVDSIAFANGTVDDIAFDADLEGMAKGTYEPIADSTVTWVGGE